jgi:protein TonB
VEETGTRHFPQKALSEGIFGNVRLAVQLKPNGTVESIDITQSSGHPFLDQAAIQSVRLAAPFAPFTDEMRRNIDLLEIIRTWRFDSRERLTSH